MSIIVWIKVWILAMILSLFFFSGINLDLAFCKPSLKYPLGCDEMGRNFLISLILSLKGSIGFAFLVTFFISKSLFILLILYWIMPNLRNLCIHLISVLEAIPGVLLIGAFMISFGFHLSSTGRKMLLAILIATQYLPRISRVILGYVQQISLQPYIIGAYAIGRTSVGVFIFYVLPEVWTRISPMLVYYWFSFMVSETFYTFLGIGLRSGDETLGVLMHKGWTYYRSQPLLLLSVLGVFLALFLTTQYKLFAIRDRD